MREALYFSGIRWPAARVVDRKQLIDDDDPVPGLVPVAVSYVDALVIETTGSGRPYEVNFIEGWWRDFAEGRLDDENHVLRFLRRRGDPFGVLAPDGTQISTRGRTWRDLKKVLEVAATAWEPQPAITPAGISRFRPERRQGAERMFDVVTGPAATGWADDLGVHYSGISRSDHAKTLAAYLCAAAAASVEAGLDMRRCGHCGSWFTLHYANARHCGNSCRAAANSNRRSPHVVVSQDHNP